MAPLPLVWPHALPFWGVYWWALWPELAIVRRAQRTKGAADARSLQVIVYGMWLAFYAAFALA